MGEAHLFIVSQVEVTDPGEVVIDIPGVGRAEGKKCERCWKYSSHVGESADYPTVCDRCVKALEEIEQSTQAGGR